MSETVEYDVVEEYDLSNVGITVDTSIRLGSISVDIDAKIDTGSTYCIFDRYFGERLQIEIETGLPVVIGTATGSFRAFGHEVTLTVIGMEFDSTVFFAESEHFDRNVLGRIGFLDRVKFGLIEPEGKIYLGRYPE